MDSFHYLGFPHCIGAVDGAHIIISAPKARAAEYVNWKSTFSVLLHGTTDHTSQFVDVSIGYSGRNYNAFVFESALCTAMDTSAFMPHNPMIWLEGISIPPLIMAAYPIQEWLMKPYSGWRLVENAV